MKSCRSLQLKHTRLNLALKQEEMLFKSITSGDRTTALALAKQLKCQAKATFHSAVIDNAGNSLGSYSYTIQ